MIDHSASLWLLSKVFAQVSHLSSRSDPEVWGSTLMIRRIQGSAIVHGYMANETSKRSATFQSSRHLTRMTESRSTGRKPLQ